MPVLTDSRHKPFLIALVTLLAVTGTTLFIASPAKAGTNGQLGIDRVNLHPPGSWRITSGLRWENKRSLTRRLDYDNWRARPLDLSYSFTKRFQTSARVMYSSNAAKTSNNSLVGDTAGVESVLLSTKARWNRNFGTVFTVGTGLSDDVFPYGGDGFQAGINFPAQLSAGPGVVLVEAGYTLKEGTVVGSEETEWSNYFNYGIGYYYELTDTLDITGEITGHDETVDTNRIKDHMDVVLKPGILLSKQSYLESSVSFSLSEGSPNFGFGLNYTYRIGGTERRRVPISEQDIGSEDFGSITEQKPPEETPDRARKRQREKPLVLPGELDAEPAADTPDRESDEADTTPERDPQKAQQLANRGREIFEDDENLQRALQYFDRAVQHDPRNVEILSNYASLLYRDKQFERAKKYYEKALDVNPDDQFSHLFLGITHYKLEEYDAAREHLERARSINVTNQTGQRAQEWLDRLNDKN